MLAVLSLLETGNRTDQEIEIRKEIKNREIKERKKSRNRTDQEDITGQ